MDRQEALNEIAEVLRQEFNLTTEESGYNAMKRIDKILTAQEGESLTVSLGRTGEWYNIILNEKEKGQIAKQKIEEYIELFRTDENRLYTPEDILAWLDKESE